MFKKTGILLVAATIGLAACGNNPTDRAISGAGIGAGAAAVTGGDPIVGGAIGAAAGAVSNPNVVNLGCPPWNPRC